MRWRFRPPWWAWLLTLIGVALFVNRCQWQLDRAEQKETLIAARANAFEVSPAMPVSGDSQPLTTGSAAALRGYFIPEFQLLLDNQILDGVPGLHVWTALRLESSGEIVLVNRGWLAWDRGQRALPEWQTPVGLVTVHGQWRELPQPAMRLGDNSCEVSAWPAVVQYPTYEEALCLLASVTEQDHELIEGILLLHPEAEHGFDRQWQNAEMPVEKHLGYAFQWAAFAVAACVIFVVLNLRRIQSDRPET